MPSPGESVREPALDQPGFIEVREFVERAGRAVLAFSSIG
jgi:hypothetical protein